MSERPIKATGSNTVTMAATSVIAAATFRRLGIALDKRFCSGKNNTAITAAQNTEPANGINSQRNANEIATNSKMKARLCMGSV
jgi:hypothetical protein